MSNGGVVKALSPLTILKYVGLVALRVNVLENLFLKYGKLDRMRRFRWLGGWKGRVEKAD